MASGLYVRVTFNTSAIASAHVHRATLTFEGLEKTISRISLCLMAVFL